MPGRARYTSLAGLALGLALVFALPPGSPASSPTDQCKLLQDERYKTLNEKYNRYIVKHTHNVTLVYDTRVEHAAAALLRAALLAAGFQYVAMHEHISGESLCDDIQRINTRALVLVPTWKEASTCVSKERELVVSGPGLAPLSAAPELHAYLGPPYVNESKCAAADTWRFYKNAAQLRDCGFLSSLSPPGSGNIIETKTATVYLLRGEKNHFDWSDALVSIASSALSRTELATRIREQNSSFLFLDATLWEDNNSTVRLVKRSSTVLSSSVRLMDEYALMVYSPALYNLFKKLELPPPKVLRQLLECAEGYDVDITQAACQLARGRCKGAPESPRVFSKWLINAMNRTAHKALVIFCEEDQKDYDAYKIMASIVGKYIQPSLKEMELGMDIDFKKVKCSVVNRSVGDLERYTQRWPARVTGVVMPTEVALAVDTCTSGVKVPLLVYDVGADEFTSVGRVEHLAHALRRLLDGCKWRRFAVLSEQTNLAELLWKRLHENSTELPPCEQKINMTSEHNITETLGQLKQAGNRVFLVNGGAEAAARVLAEAQNLTMTRAAGFVWVVLEYAEADEATAALEPYSVSFQWRGGNTGAVGNGPLLNKLEKIWPKRAWPRHAVGITNALLTLGETFKQLVIQHPEMRENISSETKSKYFSEAKRAKNISGIIKPLEYDKGGIKNPLVFIEQWGNESRPRLLDIWRTGESPSNNSCLVHPEVDDNVLYCHTSPTGDSCNLRCNDTTYIVYAIAVVLAVTALTVSAWAAKRAFENHITNVRINVTKRLLAGRERAFSVLAPFNVDRAALDRREELGAGNYGRVLRGLMRDPRGSRRRRQIAIAAKELLGDVSPEEESRFLREACALAALQHEHVVRFVGVCLEDGPPMLLMEFALFGDLLRYLQERRHLAEGAGANGDAHGDGESVGREEAAYVSAEALTRFAREAAEALAFLARRGYVHRDVRASNCLVDERRSLKLADFGLAREIDDPDGVYAMVGPRKVPVRYWAPESLQFGVSSPASDVWSLGVLALELVTLGERPFGGASLASVVEHVRGGGRPPLPRDASSDTRRLVSACWRRDAALRPAAARIATWLGERRRALRPTFDDADADSGFGEPPSLDFDIDLDAGMSLTTQRPLSSTYDTNKPLIPRCNLP